MNISSHHIQNVIRAYGQRVERKSLARLKAASQPVPRGPDSITISSEARQKQLAQKVTSDILARAGKDVNGKVSQQVVERLGNEFGGSLDLVTNRDKGKNFKFRVIDNKKGEVIKELTPEDVTRVVEKLYDKVNQDVTSEDSELKGI